MDLWSEFDKLIASSKIVIDRPKGTRHPHFPDFIYPFDYGYIEHTQSSDKNEIDVWRGSLGNNRLVALVCAFDTSKKDAETKLVIDFTDDELDSLENFYRNRTYGAGIVIRRADYIDD